MSTLERERDRSANEPFGTSELAERLRNVRKRKQSYGGQALDMEAIRRRLERERRKKRRQ